MGYALLMGMLIAVVLGLIMTQLMRIGDYLFDIKKQLEKKS